MEAFASYFEDKAECNAEAFKPKASEIRKALSDDNVFNSLNDWKKEHQGYSEVFNKLHGSGASDTTIAATGTSNWKLHLAKIEDLLPYFHAHDQYNYG